MGLMDKGGDGRRIFRSEAGEEYKQYDIVTTTKFYTPNVSWELYQVPDAQVNLSSGVKIKDIRKKEGQQKITDENLRLPYAGLNIIKSDSMGKLLFLRN